MRATQEVVLIAQQPADLAGVVTVIDMQVSRIPDLLGRFNDDPKLLRRAADYLDGLL